ncbi:hypothetical protein ACI2LD_02670 [Enterococcus casseliflavus]|uniref:hypothetical protein n=1 Tax=Enterococcus casseliflavus TaxID=37734 RepID=UPI003797C429
MEVIWLGPLYIIFIAIIVWAFWFMGSLVWLYVRLVSKFIVKFLFRLSYIKCSDRLKSPQFKIERYYSLFRTPLLFYFSLPFSTLFVSSFINDYILKNLWLEDIVVFATFALLIIVFWISVYIVFSLVKEKKQIKKTIKSHRQFIKVTMFPVSLLSIIVPIISVTNIIIEAEVKQNIVNELTKINLNSNSIALSMIFLFILIFEGLSLLVMGLLEHILENESEYLYFFNGIISFFKKFI